MSLKIYLVAAVVALAVALSTVAAVLAQVFQVPQLPHLFFGTITIGPNPAPPGTVITAKVDGVVRGSITTTQAGVYGGPDAFDPKLTVQGDDITAGATVQFFVDGAATDQTFAFESGATTELNLTSPLPTQAATLVVTTQPSASTAAGIAFAQQPVVTIKDQFGNTVTTGADSTQTITASLAGGGGVLSGILTKKAVAGVADFTGNALSIDLIGTDKVLSFSGSGNGASGTTTAFTITVATALGVTTISAFGTAASGGSVARWTAGTPDWFPIEGAVGVIDSDHTDNDGDGGGLFTFKVASVPAGSYRVTLFLLDPRENVAAYAFFNMGMKVVAAGTTTSDVIENFTSTAVSGGSFSVTLAKPHNATDTTGMTVTLDVGGGNQAVVTSNCSLGSGQKSLSCNGVNTTTYPDANYALRVASKVDSLSETGSSFTSSLSVIDHDGDDSDEASDVQILNPEKGLVSFLIDSVDGTLVDPSGDVVITGTGNARAFNIGMQSGSFFTTDATNSDNLSPEFSLEISQR